MRNGILGAVVALVLFTIVGWSHGESGWPAAPPAEPSRGGPFGSLLTHHVPGGPAGDHVVVIDPAARVMAVYRVQKDRGEIKLASVRQIQWDLQVTSYANEGPLPEEIRAGLDRQRL
jgi:hypothetical protein